MIASLLLRPTGQSVPPHQIGSSSSASLRQPSDVLYTSPPTRINDLEINRQHEELLQGNDRYVRKAIFRMSTSRRHKN